MKRLAIVLLVVLLMCASVLLTVSSIYPRYGHIRAVEYDTDLVFIEDRAGQMWIWKGVEDLECGDDIAMLMFNRLTPNTIFDDIILVIH